MGGTGASMRPRAFTLLELMVVIFILGVLVAILVPSLAAARDKAVELQCGARLHAIVQAEFMYAHDNAGVLTLLPGDPYYTAHPEQTEFIDWQVRLAPYLPIPPVEVRSAQEQYLKVPECYDRKWVINCPGREPDPGQSYALNRHLGPLPADGGFNVSDWSYRLARPPSPASIILLGDCTPFAPDVDDCQSFLAPDELGMTRCQPAFRHGAGHAEGSAPVGRANFGFVDGHVEGLHYAETLTPSGHWRWW